MWSLGGEVENASVSVLGFKPPPTEIKNSPHHCMNLVMMKGTSTDQQDSWNNSTDTGTRSRVRALLGPLTPVQGLAIPWLGDFGSQHRDWLACDQHHVCLCLLRQSHHTTKVQGADAMMSLSSFSALCLSFSAPCLSCAYNSSLCVFQSYWRWNLMKVVVIPLLIIINILTLTANVSWVLSMCQTLLRAFYL